MIYPKELQLTELEEHYILARLDFLSPSETLQEIIYCINDGSLKSYEDKDDLEQCIREESKYFEEGTIDILMTNEEKDVLKKKLENRKAYRRDYEKWLNAQYGWQNTST